MDSRSPGSRGLQLARIFLCIALLLYPVVFATKDNVPALEVPNFPVAWKMVAPTGAVLPIPLEETIGNVLDESMWGNNFTLAVTVTLSESLTSLGSSRLQVLVSRKERVEACGGIYLGIRGAGVVELGVECGGGVRFGKYRLKIGMPHWIVITMEGSTATLYVDGVYRDQQDVHDYHRPCPQGWALADDGKLCSAPDSYSRKCCMTSELPACRANFADTSVAFRADWSRRCDATWPFLAFHSDARSLILGTSSMDGTTNMLSSSGSLCSVSIYRGAMPHAMVEKMYWNISQWMASCGQYAPSSSFRATRRRSSGQVVGKSAESTVDLAESGSRSTAAEAVKFVGPTKPRQGTQVVASRVPESMWGGKFSVSAVVSVVDATAHEKQVLLSRTEASNPCGGVEIYLKEDKITIARMCSEDHAVSLNAGLSGVKRAHVAVMYDADSGTAKLFVNGEQKHSHNATQDFSHECPQHWSRSDDNLCIDSKLQPREIGCSSGAMACAPGSWCCTETIAVFGDKGTHCVTEGTCLETCQSAADPRDDRGMCKGTPTFDRSTCCNAQHKPKCAFNFNDMDAGQRQEYADRCHTKWPLLTLDFNNPGGFEVASSSPDGTVDSWHGVVCSLDLFSGVLSDEDVGDIFSAKGDAVDSCDGTGDTLNSANATATNSNSTAEAASEARKVAEGKKKSRVLDPFYQPDPDAHYSSDYVFNPNSKTWREQDVCDKIIDDTEQNVMRIASEMQVTKQALECAWHFNHPFPGYQALRLWRDDYVKTGFKESHPDDQFQPDCLRTLTMDTSVDLMNNLVRASGHTLDECFDAMKTREASMDFLVKLKLDNTVPRDEFHRIANFLGLPESSLPWVQYHMETKEQQDEILKDMPALLVQVEKVKQKCEDLAANSAHIEGKLRESVAMSATNQANVDTLGLEVDKSSQREQRFVADTEDMNGEFNRWFGLFTDVKELMEKRGLHTMMGVVDKDRHDLVATSGAVFSKAQGRILKKVDEMRDANMYIWDRMMNATTFAVDAIDQFVEDMTAIQERWKQETKSIGDMYDEARVEMVQTAEGALDEGLRVILSSTEQKLSTGVKASKDSIKRFLANSEGMDSGIVRQLQSKVDSLGHTYDSIREEIKTLKKEEEEVDVHGRTMVTALDTKINSNVAELDEMSEQVREGSARATKQASSITNEYIDLITNAKDAVTRAATTNRDNAMKNKIFSYIHNIEKHYDFLLNTIETSIEGTGSSMTSVLTRLQEDDANIDKVLMTYNQGQIPKLTADIDTIGYRMKDLAGFIKIVAKNNSLSKAELKTLAQKYANTNSDIKVEVPKLPTEGFSAKALCNGNCGGR